MKKLSTVWSLRKSFPLSKRKRPPFQQDFTLPPHPTPFSISNQHMLRDDACDLCVFPFACYLLEISSQPQECSDSIEKMNQTKESPCPMLNLQRGQVAFIRSHLTMHRVWKWWLQGSMHSWTPCTYWARHMQHAYKYNTIELIKQQRVLQGYNKGTMKKKKGMETRNHDTVCVR